MPSLDLAWSSLQEWTEAFPALWRVVLAQLAYVGLIAYGTNLAGLCSVSCEG